MKTPEVGAAVRPASEARPAIEGLEDGMDRIGDRDLFSRSTVLHTLPE